MQLFRLKLDCLYLARASPMPVTPRNADEAMALGYLCDSWLAKLGNPDQKGDTILKLSPLIWRLSRDEKGCRVVQKAFDVANLSEEKLIAKGLFGHVREAVACPHANHVVQKLISVCPAESTRFVANELIGVGVETARHRFGCRVINRLIENCGHTPETDRLIQEICSKAGSLCMSTYGHHVAICLLENGEEAHRQKIVDELNANLPKYAGRRHASACVETALLQCSAKDQHALVSSLMKDDILVEILRTRIGFYVGRAFAEVGGQPASQFLRDNAEVLRKTQSGVRLSKHVPDVFAAESTPRTNIPPTTPHGMRASQEKHNFSETEVFLNSKNVSIIMADVSNLTWNTFLNQLLFDIGLSLEDVFHSEIRVLYHGHWHTRAEACGIQGDLMIAREATVVVST